MPLNVDKISTGSLSVNGIEINNSGLQTVAVDGVTITGDGTLGDPLVAVTPTPSYKVYSAMLTQTGTSAPVEMFVFQNTIGTVQWFYDSVGQYKTNVLGVNGEVFTLCGGASTNPNRISITPDLFGKVNIVTTNNTSISNNVLTYTCVEIRVYN